ncbi:hypothetical protein GR702_01005 [Novosphingobium sp. FGD1]|jgi:hypothetical protein|uniref:Uncharacterized protein n=1 Tax=Novosphingobium silvae TaxID=2692619 RepID=A0A7X4K5Y0_9SPHN|nr:hypothetical protein [Novosphingobium silvae]MYL96352.1 hypothetical protein [Novosphingobium silvae]
MPITDLPPAPPAFEASAFDLEQMAPAQGGDFRAVKPRCPQGRPGEIVVCAPDPEKERVRPLPDTYVVADGPPRAEIQLNDAVTLDAHLDSATMPNGQTAQRIMVGAKIKF